MKTYSLSAGDLQVSLLQTEEGICLHRIVDRRSGRVFLKEDGCLFTLTARGLAEGSLVTVDSASGWKKVSVCGEYPVYTVSCSQNKALPCVTVVLTATASERDHSLSWTVHLHSENREYSLYECDYPILTFGACSRTKVFFPYGCGEVYPSMRTFATRQNYPSYGASMEYMALWHTGAGRGLYYGLHDPAPAYKKLHYEKKADALPFMKSCMPLRDIDKGENSQSLEGVCVWQLFDGDWYDAALLYKKFFEEHASWKPAVENGKRKDLPEWLRTNPHWWRKRMKWDESFADELLAASEDLGLYSPVHLYDWFQIPYDTNYPHYFPAKEAFLPGMRRLQEKGSKVMPYINGRLWDTHDKGKEDWQFTSVARPNCTKKRVD